MTEDLFPSFWMAGFECSSQVQPGRGRLDLIAELQHDRFAEEDYRMLLPFGLRTVRDGIRWHIIESEPGRYDLSSVEPMCRAAGRAGVAVIWDIMHFGLPDGMSLLDPAFPERYAHFAHAFARYMRSRSDATPVYVPINEMSYLAAAAGDLARFQHAAIGKTYDIKCALARAAIMGMDAIREVDSRARFVHTEPLIHNVATPDRPDLMEAARARNEAQFEALEMLCGRREPQLGGAPRYLDILGCNFYPHNEADVEEHVLPRSDPRWMDLSILLVEVYGRFGRPILISETSGTGPMRADWLEYVAGEALKALQFGLPLQGICLYPITNSPDWRTDTWQAFGLWNLVRRPDGRLARVLDKPTAAALRAAQERLAPHIPAARAQFPAPA